MSSRSSATKLIVPASFDLKRARATHRTAEVEGGTPSVSSSSSTAWYIIILLVALCGNSNERAFVPSSRSPVVARARRERPFLSRVGKPIESPTSSASVSLEGTPLQRKHAGDQTDLWTTCVVASGVATLLATPRSDWHCRRLRKLHAPCAAVGIHSVVAARSRRRFLVTELLPACKLSALDEGLVPSLVEGKLHSHVPALSRRRLLVDGLLGGLVISDSDEVPARVSLSSSRRSAIGAPTAQVRRAASQ